MDIDGKVMIITGASAGIGESTARAAAAAGAKLVLAARREGRLTALASELGDAVAVGTDMRDGEQIQHMVDVATERFGGVDILVNNAGQGLHVPIEQIQLDDFRAIIELNLYGSLLAIQAVVPHMRRRGGGSIINVSSGTTRLARAVGAGAYSSSKAALNMLSRTARSEFADDRIIVSTVYPFVTDTEFHDVLRAGGRPGARNGFTADPPERVADAILELIRTGDEEILLVPEHLRGAVS